MTTALSDHLIRIKVTKDHIERGEFYDKRECPVALAIKDAYPDARICVDEACIEVNHIYYPTPARVERFINRFDTGKSVRPFSFDLSQILKGKTWDSI